MTCVSDAVEGATGAFLPTGFCFCSRRVAAPLLPLSSSYSRLSLSSLSECVMVYCCCRRYSLVHILDMERERGGPHPPTPLGFYSASGACSSQATPGGGGSLFFCFSFSALVVIFPCSSLSLSLSRFSDRWCCSRFLLRRPLFIFFYHSHNIP